MPQFVLLIPVLMLFKVGEFTALLAIIAYAIVPMIRYVEHGLRNVPPEIVEASTQIGCTSRQILFEVKLPLALPVIMLGLNQTVMYGLAMLVIAALVGTQGLGQQVYLALSAANSGAGLVTGLSIALICDGHGPYLPGDEPQTARGAGPVANAPSASIMVLPGSSAARRGEQNE